MDHGQFKVTLKKVDKKFAYTICELELTNVEVRTYICIQAGHLVVAIGAGYMYACVVWMDAVLIAYCNSCHTYRRNVK